MSTINETIKQLESQRSTAEKEVAALTAAINALTGLSTGATPTIATPVATAKKPTMSAAGRARLAAAQKARWAKINAGKTAAKPAAVKPVVAKPKKTMSPAAIAKIRAFQKARWAKIKGAKKAS